MDKLFIIALILSAMPISELRGGMPIAIAYALKNNISLFFVFSVVILMNILGMLLSFFILDHLHKKLMKIQRYKKFFERKVNRLRKKTERVRKNYSSLGFVALTAFVAIPLPGTGAWTGSFIAWLLGLNRKKSLLSISLGVLIAGIIVFIGTLGIFSLFKI
jgi:uncharacterized membrane protein